MSRRNLYLLLRVCRCKHDFWLVALETPMPFIVTVYVAFVFVHWAITDDPTNRATKYGEVMVDTGTALLFRTSSSITLSDVAGEWHVETVMRKRTK